MEIHLSRSLRTPSTEKYYIFSHTEGVGIALPEQSATKSRLGSFYIVYDAVSKHNHVDLFLEGEVPEECQEMIIGKITNLVDCSGVYGATSVTLHHMTTTNTFWDWDVERDA